MDNGNKPAVIATFAAIVLLVVTAPCRAEQNPPHLAELEAEVRRLLIELDAPSRAARSSAAVRLLDLGPKVLPHLPPPELLTSVSVRESVDRIRHELERRQADASTRASRVELGGVRPLEEWLAQITLQTGNKFDPSELKTAFLEKPLTIEGDSHEFWPLVDELAARGGFTFEAHVSDRQLKLLLPPDKNAETSVARSYAGPFRLTASPVAIVSFGEGAGADGANKRKRLARMVLSVQPEPRLRPLFLQFAMADIAAITAETGKLRPFSPDASYELSVGEPGGRSKLQLDYLLPPGPLPKMLDLKGALRATVAAGNAPIRFDHLTKRADGKPIGVERRRGGVTATLVRVRQVTSHDTSAELRVQITIAYDKGGPAFESHRRWMLHNEVFLEFANGTRMAVNGGVETTMESDGAVGMECRFVELSDPIPDCTFVYVAPTLIVDVPVEFALESVPIERPRPQR